MPVFIFANFGDAIESECVPMAVTVTCRKCGTARAVSNLYRGKVVTVTCAKCRHAQAIAIPLDTSMARTPQQGPPAPSANDPPDAHGSAQSEESNAPTPACLRRSSLRWVRAANELARRELMLELSASETRLSLLERSALSLWAQTFEEEMDWRAEHPPEYGRPRFSVWALLQILFGPLVSFLYVLHSTKPVDDYKHPMENVVKNTEKEVQDLKIRVGILRRIAKSSGLLPEVLTFLGPGLLSILCYILILIVALALAPLFQPPTGGIIRLVALVGGFIAALVIWRVNTPLHVGLQRYRLWPPRQSALPRERFSHLGICFLAFFVLIVLSWLVGRGIILGQTGA